MKAVASRVASISSIATLGGAVGKFVNGFVCQALGSQLSSRLYFLGLAICSFLFSCANSPQTLGLAYAGIEFCASIQFAAMNVMLSNYYERSPKQLAVALAVPGLASTLGTVFAKTAGTTLAMTLNWRLVARLGSLVATLGSLWVARAPATSSRQTFSFSSIVRSLRATLGSRLFLVLGFAHGIAFVARGTERILGTFYQYMAPELSQALSGGLTLSVTLGLMHGLITGSRTIAKMENDPAAKRRFLNRRYLRSILATCAMILLCSKPVASTLPPSTWLRTGLTAALSFTTISNIAFQFYQFPAMIAKSQFEDHKAVAISFLDGFGFLLSTPVFALASRIVPEYGWVATWSMFAGIFAVGAIMMLAAIGPVLRNP